MKRTGRVSRKRFWFVLGFAVMLAVMVGGQVFAAEFATEEDALLYMREEEKLARDVYTVLYAMWGLPIFDNIAVSEQQHMDAVKTLLERYGLEDPAKEGQGEFTNEKIQALYDTLIAQGSISIVDALNVGIIIEETDIEDLEAALAVTVHKDTRRVFINLMAASYNHLEAFNSKLQN